MGGQVEGLAAQFDRVEADQNDSVLLSQIVVGLPEPLRDVATVIECFLALSAGQGPRNSRQCRSRGAP